MMNEDSHSDGLKLAGINCSLLLNAVNTKARD